MEKINLFFTTILQIYLLTHAQQINITQDAAGTKFQPASLPITHSPDVLGNIIEEDASYTIVSESPTATINQFSGNRNSLDTPVGDAEQIVNDISNIIEVDTTIDDSDDNMDDETDRRQSSVNSFGPVSSPFFFMCHYPRPGEPSGTGREEITVKVELTGTESNFTGYEPHSIYQVLVTSNVVFDGFMLTGIHAFTKHNTETNYINIPASLHGGKSEGLVCAVLHSHISHKPRRRLSFLWMAPPSGTGCVAFLAQGTLGEELLFKDLPVLEVCEKESGVGALKIATSLFTGVDLPGLIFRDDFESYQLETSIWSDMTGGMLGQSNGRILHGSAATFTEPGAFITTRPLDLLKAKNLQFAVGSGSCSEGATVQLAYGSVEKIRHRAKPARFRMHGPVVSRLDNYEGSGDVMGDIVEGSGDEKIARLVKVNDVDDGNLEEDENLLTNIINVPVDSKADGSECTSWEVVHTYSVGPSSEVHMEAVPQRYRRKGVCVRWQSVVGTSENNSSCWGIDNVAVSSIQVSSEPLYDDFDPVDTSNWMFFPGDKIQESCGSEGNALVFSNGRVITRLMDLQVTPPTEDIILEHYFRHSSPSGWQIKGGSVERCGDQQRLTFAREGIRRVCTPHIDVRNVGVINVSMHLGECSRIHSGDVIRVNIYAEKGTSVVSLREYPLSNSKRIYTIPVEDIHNLLNITRICVEQTVYAKNDTDVWVLDHLRLLPWLPKQPNHFLQGRVNLECGNGVSEVEVESSADDGLTWVPLHRRCLPAWCDRQHSAFSSSLRPQEIDRWGLVTLPLPYFSLTPHTRFRLRNMEGTTNKAIDSSWALDNVYIGVCYLGCSGRGLCQPDGTCKCEYGYSGIACGDPDHDNPLYVSEPFSSPIAESANILKMTGGRTSFRCGVVGSGLAAVFLGGGPRAITTVDVNTTHAHFIQFHYVAGTFSEVGKCPGPNHASESVYVHYSCNGGVSWHLLHTLPASQHKEPSHISLLLPPGAQGPGCRFQLWQDTHSGYGQDVWAIDDLTVTSRIFNSIQLDFSDSQAVNNSLRFHLGELGGGVCGRDSVMMFEDAIATGSSRFIETKSIGVGPSYMIQFDLVIGCGEMLAQDTINKVLLEYSLNHGISWLLVHRPCAPSTPGCESHFTRGTVYEHSEFRNWKRITLPLPQRTWSPTTRLRLRQTEDTDVSESWAVDNLYIGRLCPGLCSGHGYCTIEGCSCDDDFHGHKCLPVHKLHRHVDATFDVDDDLAKYDFHVIGGSLVAREEGCGHVISRNSLYFGAPGIRQFETDDLNAEDLEIIQFMLVIGNGGSSNCIPADEEETLSAGSVVLEYSTDGGISWELLQELLPSQYRNPRLFRSKLEAEVVKADTGVVRFRIWQPTHSGQNQWAIDNLRITPDLQMSSLQADFAPGSSMVSPWMSVTGNHHSHYCKSEDQAQVMDGEEPVRLAVTHPLTLDVADVISFQISVGCESERNIEGSPVLLQYSKDGGIEWSLVDEGCPSTAIYCNGPKEPSIYRPQHHGPWTRVMLPVDHRLALGTIQLRWLQSNPGETSAGEFAIRDLYIGPPCPLACHGHGLCTAAGLCKCDLGYNGTYCGRSKTKRARWMQDDFDHAGETSPMWERTEGASVAAGCGPHHTGNTLLFSSSGPRFATTKEMDTRSIKYLVFNLQIGSTESGGRCQHGQVPRDNVLLQHSPDNGQTWHSLQLFEPSQTTNRREAFFIPLPNEARTRQTRFRWWQGFNEMMQADDAIVEVDERAEWHLDNVMVLANETLPQDLYDTFDGNTSRAITWFMSSGSSLTQGCGTQDPIMLFSGHAGPKYAETWDFVASESSVIQFDIKVGCEGSGLGGEVELQYSNDHGKMWHPVAQLCSPPEVECVTYHLPSTYTTAVNPEWSRVTTTLPKKAMGENTRLRLISNGAGTNGVKTASWAIDNFYVGNSCPWMCSGHGYCFNGVCKCDPGYFGDYCVPARVLPCELLDTFNEPILNESYWIDSYGAEVSHRCGVLVSKTALVFFKDGLRLATTIDMDMTSGQFVQFNIHMGCKRSPVNRNKRSAMTFLESPLPVYKEEESPSRAYGILVQYSTNGGITWQLLKEMHYQAQLEPGFVSINLDDFPHTRSNATRFRIWQPRHEGAMSQSWAIDNIFIGGMPISPNVLYEDFNKGSPMVDAWIDWPAGEVGFLCDEHDSYTGLIFGNEEGEHALYTRDLAVDTHSVLQFDIRVGCGAVTSAEHSVSLQYSTDYGFSWTTIHPTAKVAHSSPDCLHELRTPSVFYTNSERGWARFIVPLEGLQICGIVRFRWWQGYYRGKESSSVWGVDNIYIGPACIHHCSGHGYCINGDQCVCDDDYEGDGDCTLTTKISQTLLEDFEAGSLEDQFLKWSGAEVSRFCGVLTGDALVFSQQGERMLVTSDLDLSQGSVVQFYIRFGCMLDDTTNEDGPVLLHFSIDGGISWTLLAELGRDSGHLGGLPHTHHITLSLPETSKSNTTRLRWWQPSKDGSFKFQWAVDQIHIGSTALGLPAFTDIDTGSGWLLRPGSVMESVCGNSHTSIHFTSREGYRFAETPDILVNEHSFIQFTAALGCKDNGACFQVELEYSTDQGFSWWPVKVKCYPSDPDCTEYWPSSILTSDLYTGPTQVTMRLPYKTRTELTRLRFIQRDGYRQQNTWSLSHVYVGDECYFLCSGRGFCDAGVCHCHNGWTGSSCEMPEEPLPTFIVSEFSGEADPSHWRKIVGAQTTSHCGVIASGQALHFTGGCSRYIETIDLDLREALFIQFDLRTGCLDPVSGRESGGDHSILVQISCDAGLSWTTVKKLLLIYHQPTYVWLKIPNNNRCLGGRVRWWQPNGGERNRYDWAVDSVVVGGNVTPPHSVTYAKAHQLAPPLWLRRYNTEMGKYCENRIATHVMMSTPAEPALLQTTDIQVGRNHSINFELAMGCGATWDNTDEPVRLEYSVDFGNSWQLVRDMCLPGSSSCFEITDASIYYSPLNWNRYVYPLDHIGPAKYVRFRWIQEASSDVTGSHQWSLRDVYIGVSCPKHCLGRGSCLDAVCHCQSGYAGTYCQHVLNNNVPFIRDEFSENVFQNHFSQVQGGLLSEGCGALEEPPTATFQGFNTRMLRTIPVDIRSGRFVHFIAQIGSPHGTNICRRASNRHHNVFLQYSVDGGIRWHLLRELDHKLYTLPSKEYILIPVHARSPATLFRFWQPRLENTPPAWSVDDLYIGGSEISDAQLMDRFEGEPTISEWLFAPHSENQQEYCSSGTNGSLVWGPDSPGHRAITTQELIINEGHVLQFKLSVGCGEPRHTCGGEKSGVRLEYSRDGGVTGWELVMDSCLPSTSPDPDCTPYFFHTRSIFRTDIYSQWTRITIPLPEKTWASTTQLRWTQEVAGLGSKVTAWSLDDVYVGDPCPYHCHGHGDCVEAQCVCDAGFVGEACEPVPSRSSPLPTSLVDGFEAGVDVNWLQVTGGAVGLGCSSLAPYGHGKHLYFSGCGTRQAVTKDMDTRRASKIMFVLRIGSQDNTPSCHVDLSDPQRALDKGVILQYTADNGVTWNTINVHDPLDFRKARRVAYSFPHDARQYGVQLRWWQPDHDGANTDQWAIDNVEIVLAQRKDTSKYETKTFHDSEL